MKFDRTSQTFFQLRSAPDVTSESQRPRVEHVISTLMAVGQLTDRVTGELERSFERALANGREHAWELFVERAQQLAPRLEESDLRWLRHALIVRQSSGRATAALVRALGVIAEARPDFATPCLEIFELLTRNPSAEVRSLVLEWAMELGPAHARTLAEQLRDDPHPAVQQAARAVLAAR